MALITPASSARHVVVEACDPGTHDPSFDAVGNQLSEKPFIVAALDGLIAWARAGSMIRLQFGLRLLRS
jgi:hypothetical protein